MTLPASLDFARLCRSSTLALALALPACLSQGGDTTSGPALSSVEKVVSSVDCPQGGLIVSTGHDQNGNGSLDADEVTSAASVCGGRDGAKSLIRLENEAVGEHCAEGGTRVSSGLDDGREGGTAGNGLLEPGEVTDVQYVCNGRNGRDGRDGNAAPAALARSEAVPSNVACPAGGFRLETGIDDGRSGGTAANGTLEAGEVRTTTYVCNGSPGVAGVAGLNALIETSAVVEGDPACPAGGITVRTGLDDGRNLGTSGDQVLQDGEVRDARNVCNGLRGPSGFNALLVTEAEAPGAECVSGGSKLLFGLDDGANGGTAGDGLLGPGEVTSTRYLCNGLAGVGALTGISPIAQGGADCFFGGVSIETGRDDGTPAGTAHDGVLDPAEVDQSSIVCNGMPGARGSDGANALFETDAEPAGAACAFGGVKLIAGVDDGLADGVAGDGALQPGEVRTTRYICNGSTGAAGPDGLAGADAFNSLVRTTSEAVGENCAAGGVLVETGLDDGVPSGTARNGVLEAGEVTEQRYVCNGTAGAGGVSTGLGVLKDSADQTMGAIQTVGTSNVSLRSPTGYYFTLGWTGTYPDQQIYYSNGGCSGSMWLNAGTTNLSYRLARYLVYEAMTGNFHVPTNVDANGMAANVAFTAPALWNSSGGVWQCVSGGSNGGWLLTPISRIAAGIPSEVVVPLSIE